MTPWSRIPGLIVRLLTTCPLLSYSPGNDGFWQNRQTESYAHNQEEARYISGRWQVHVPVTDKEREGKEVAGKCKAHVCGAKSLIDYHLFALVEVYIHPSRKPGSKWIPS